MAFLAPGAKMAYHLCFWPILGNFWCLVITLITFDSNPNNLDFFVVNPNNEKNSQKNYIFF